MMKLLGNFLALTAKKQWTVIKASGSEKLVMMFYEMLSIGLA